LYKGAGCKACGNTGYSGRIGIFEVMEVSEALRPLIVGKEPSSVIDKKAKELGMTSMLEDGISKAFKGVTTLEEIMRATKS
jgi:type II secretory ATPase GspE/PulE/Tfp pilus assembly ATPase PilB-like protein